MPGRQFREQPGCTCIAWRFRKQPRCTCISLAVQEAAPLHLHCLRSRLHQAAARPRAGGPMAAAYPVPAPPVEGRRRAGLPATRPVVRQAHRHWQLGAARCPAPAKPAEQQRSGTSASSRQQQDEEAPPSRRGQALLQRGVLQGHSQWCSLTATCLPGRCIFSVSNLTADQRQVMQEASAAGH
jgi:hypothetical protein